MSEYKENTVFVLVRTSNRPNFFGKCIESIRNQTYKDIFIITHSDNIADKYVEGDIIVRSDPHPEEGNGFYNLYNNELLKAIPENVSGWYHFIDDDDMYFDETVIERLVAQSKKDCVNVGRSQRRDGVIYPKSWKNQKSFQTECFFLHTEQKNKATWWAQRAGDHHYSSQLTKTLPINWIDMIICKAQAGKGYGKRMDFHEQLEFTNKKARTYRCGARVNSPDHMFVKYLEDVFGRDCLRGKKNQEKFLHKDYAEVLEKQGKIKILRG